MPVDVSPADRLIETHLGNVAVGDPRQRGAWRAARKALRVATIHFGQIRGLDDPLDGIRLGVRYLLSHERYVEAEVFAGLGLHKSPGLLREVANVKSGSPVLLPDVNRSSTKPSLFARPLTPTFGLSPYEPDEDFPDAQGRQAWLNATLGAQAEKAEAVDRETQLEIMLAENFSAAGSLLRAASISDSLPEIVGADRVLYVVHAYDIAGMVREVSPGTPLYVADQPQFDAGKTLAPFGAVFAAVHGLEPFEFEWPSQPVDDAPAITLNPTSFRKDIDVLIQGGVIDDEIQRQLFLTRDALTATLQKNWPDDVPIHSRPGVEHWWRDDGPHFGLNGWSGAQRGLAVADTYAFLKSFERVGGAAQRWLQELGSNDIRKFVQQTSGLSPDEALLYFSLIELDQTAHKLALAGEVVHPGPAVASLVNAANGNIAAADLMAAEGRFVARS